MIGGDAGDKVSPARLHQALSDSGVDFYTGVPDSLLKEFIAYVTDHAGSDRHIVAANEGGAIALAAGYHLATNRLAAVYLQNSGLGNAINPLASLVDPAVYGIPMLLIVGWRGMPGVSDEPQHVKQGRITIGQLELLGLPYVTLSHGHQDVEATVSHLVASAQSGRTPVALVVPPGTFEGHVRRTEPAPSSYGLRREDALEAVLSHVGPSDVVVSTTGMASREVFELRERAGQGHSQDFLTVGSMGHCSQIALGISLAKPDRQTFCLDGDGAVLMHLGALAIIGSHARRNFRHIVINNGAHDSVGGQPTAGFAVDIAGIAAACRYNSTRRVEALTDIPGAMSELAGIDGPTLLEVRVDSGARRDLGRPTSSPGQNKALFMAFLR